MDGIFSKRFYPPAFDAPISRRNIAMTFDTENLEWRGYPMVKKVWGYDYLFWQTDTQKDGHRMTSKEKIVLAITQQPTAPILVKFCTEKQNSMAMEATWHKLEIYSRWPMAAILQIIKSPYISTKKNHPILMKFGTQRQIWNSMTASWANMNIFKIQDDGRPPF